MVASLERKGRRRKRLKLSSRFAVFAIGLVLLFSEVCLFSSAEKVKSRWSPARKARFIDSRSNDDHVRPVSTATLRRHDEKSNDLFDEDKRLVHTGPNPLHN